MEIESLSRRQSSLSPRIPLPSPSLHLSSPPPTNTRPSLSLSPSCRAPFEPVPRLPWLPLCHTLFHLHLQSTFPNLPSASSTYSPAKLQHSASTDQPFPLFRQRLQRHRPRPPLSHPTTDPATPPCVPHLSNDLLLMLYQLTLQTGPSLPPSHSLFPLSRSFPGPAYLPSLYASSLPVFSLSFDHPSFLPSTLDPPPSVNPGVQPVHAARSQVERVHGEGRARVVAYFLEGVTGVRIFQASGSSASLLPLLDKFSGEGGGGGMFCSRIIPLRGKLFLVRCAPLSLSFSFPETRDGLHGTRKRV